MKRRSLVALALAVAAGSCAHGGVPGRFVVIPGHCERLVIRNADATANCHSSVSRVTDGTGRSSFDFIQTGGPALTFSGTGATRLGDARRLQVDRVRLAVLTAHGPIFESSWRATGSCEWTDPFSGRPGYVRCSARTAEGEFSGSFASNGQLPTIFR